MYKIYINNKPLILISTAEIANFKDNDKIFLAKYPGKPKFLLNYIDMMEKNNRFDKVVLYDDDAKKIFKDLKKVTRTVIAAGGVVKNDEGKILAIFRKGFWDIPKGHLDKGESKREAAVREVMEETGLHQVHIGKKAGKTYHIYKEKTRILKISHWYFMKAGQKTLIPQTGEGIEQVKWMKPGKLLNKPCIYASIKELLSTVLS